MQSDSDINTTPCVESYAAFNDQMQATRSFFESNAEYTQQLIEKGTGTDTNAGYYISCSKKVLQLQSASLNVYN